MREINEFPTVAPRIRFRARCCRLCPEAVFLSQRRMVQMLVCLVTTISRKAGSSVVERNLSKVANFESLDHAQVWVAQQTLYSCRTTKTPKPYKQPNIPCQKPQQKPTTKAALTIHKRSPRFFVLEVITLQYAIW